MAKGFKHGAGGGAGLNFKVVGGTSAPSNPKENTILVDTNTPISGYHFGNEEPLVSDGNELTLALQHDGVYGTLDGSIVEDSNYTTKIFHLPTGARKVCIRIDNYSASNAAHTFFDKDSVPVSSFHRQAGYSFIDVPDNVAYVVLAVRNSETASVTGTNPEEGMVWIPTGTSSTVPFNALKKNGITVCPLSAKQGVNGVWESKNARIYKDGNWKAFQFDVAPNTDLNWVSLSATVNKTPVSTSITHTVKSSYNGKNANSYAYVDVDFTGYNTLYAKCTHSCNNTSNSDNLWTLQLTSTSGDVVIYIMSREVPKNSNSANEVFENFVDVSALTGKYRFRSKVDHFTTTSVTHYVTITECRLY